jgi:hypothetical protein
MLYGDGLVHLAERGSSLLFTNNALCQQSLSIQASKMRGTYPMVVYKSDGFESRLPTVNGDHRRTCRIRPLYSIIIRTSLDPRRQEPRRRKFQSGVLFRLEVLGPR